MDFATVDPTVAIKGVFERFDKSGEKPQLRLLINNVGVLDREKILQMSPSELESLIRVNIFTQVFMTKYARAVMPTDKRNSIVTLSSIIAEFIVPFHGTYSATKVFNKVYAKLAHGAISTNKPDTLLV
jgi:short-subunit dehydrogenase